MWGMNIKSLKIIYPDLEFHAVEINKKQQNLEETSPENIFQESILILNPTKMEP